VRVSGILRSAEAAKAVLAIDGCPLDCAKKILELAGIKNILHIRLSDLNLLKGRSEVSVRHIYKLTEKGEAMLKEVCS
jgi:uncharacterized metal-binding protein